MYTQECTQNFICRMIVFIPDSKFVNEFLAVSQRCQSSIIMMKKKYKEYMFNQCRFIDLVRKFKQELYYH